MEACIKKFSENDVQGSFLILLNRLEDIWKRLPDISNLRKLCKRDRRLPSALKNTLRDAETLEDMFDLLMRSKYFFNWLDIRILKNMATEADIPEATIVIKLFEDCIYCKKCSEIGEKAILKCISSDHHNSVRDKLKARNITVSELINFLHTCK